MKPAFRETRAADSPALLTLWQALFDDPPGFAARFLQALPELGFGLAALRGNKIVGAAYLVTALTLVGAGRPLRCGYLYAVGVREDVQGQGIGGELCRRIAALGRERGVELIATLPAEPSLYAWYERQLGLNRVLRRDCRALDSRPGAAVEALRPEDYGLRREALLSAVPHLRLSEAALRFEGYNLGLSGGGFYAVGDGVAAACPTPEGALVRELLGAGEAEAAALGAFLGCGSVRLWQSGENGAPFVVCDAAALPADTVWSFAFD